jgi:heme-degrading monooxygenase HmoA
MSVVRIATFDPAPVLQDDDDRRAQTLRDLLRSLPGFVAGYHLREEGTGRLIDLSVWESEGALEAAEEAVRGRPASDQRGIRPTKVERWIVDSAF